MPPLLDPGEQAPAASPVGQASLPAIPDDVSPLITWRGQVIEIFRRLLAEGGWLTPAELPAYLLAPLNEGKVPLPGRLLVAGLESPAPAENAFLQAVARRTRVEHLQVRGDPQTVQQAVVLPDRGQEVAWVAAQLLESAARGVPLHRLAVTALDLEHYAPQLPRALAELLGPAQSAAGWAYNFSQGPRLSEDPALPGRHPAPEVHHQRRAPGRPGVACCCRRFMAA